jgi:hypothetical protein
MAKGLKPSDYKSLGSISGLRFDSSWEQNSQDLTVCVCTFSGSQRSRGHQDACGDFLNLKDLSAQSSKMPLGV